MSYLTYCLQYNISRRRSCPLLLTKIKITLIMSDKTIPATPQDEGSTDKTKKISHSETGHAKNVANLEDLIIKCESFGAPYNPTNSKITIAALTALHTLASNSLQTVSDLFPTWIISVNNREAVFNPLRKLVTRIYNSVASCGASSLVVADVKTITRKMQGRRAKAIPKPIVKTEHTENELEEIHKYISVCQTSMDNQVENLYKLIQLLLSIPEYTPNEVDLQTASLTTLLNNMKSGNTAVIAATAPLNLARIQRNKVLYHPETGLVAIAGKVKKYVKSVFGAKSAQYYEVSKILFKGNNDLTNKIK